MENVGISDTKYVGNSVESEMVKHVLRTHNIDFAVQDSGEVSYFTAEGRGANAGGREVRFFVKILCSVGRHKCALIRRADRCGHCCGDVLI